MLASEAQVAAAVDAVMANAIPYAPDFHTFRQQVRLLYVKLSRRVPPEVKMTAWPIMHHYVRRAAPESGATERLLLDIVTGVCVEEMVRVFELPRCDFRAPTLLFAVQHCGHRTVTALCRDGDAEFGEAEGFMDVVARAPVDTLRALAYNLVAPPPRLNARVWGGGTALHVVCRERPSGDLFKCIDFLVRMGADPTLLDDARVSPRALLPLTEWAARYILKTNERPQRKWKVVREVLRLPLLPPELSRRIARQLFVAC